MSPPDRGGDILFLPRLSVRPSVHQSVTQSCPLYNLKTAQDIFMKLRRNIKNHQTIADHKNHNSWLYFLELFLFEIREW